MTANNQTGSAMLVSLVVLLMLGLIGIASIQTSDTDFSIADNYQSGIKSLYIAEAGVELAYAVRRDTATWREGFADYAFGGGAFTVSIVDSTDSLALDDTVIVYSTGVRDAAVTSLEVHFAAARPFRWAAFGDDYLKVCGTSMTDSFDSDSGSYAATRRDEEGNVGSNGPVSICGSADVNGDAMTSDPGQMTITGSASVSGDTTTTAPVVILDPITAEEIAWAKANSNAPAGLSGGYTYNNGTKNLRVNPGQTLTMQSGVYYFNDIDINGTIQLAAGAEVQVYLGGDAFLQAQSRINVGNKPARFQVFSVGDDFRVAGGAEFWGVLYAPETSFRLTGGADLYGSFIANVSDDVGGSSFHFDRSLKDLKRSRTLHKISWREIMPT